MALTADQLIAEIETMTVLDLANLVKALEDRFGVSAAAAAAQQAAAADSRSHDRGAVDRPRCWKYSVTQDQSG